MPFFSGIHMHAILYVFFRMINCSMLFDIFNMFPYFLASGNVNFINLYEIF